MRKSCPVAPLSPTESGRALRGAVCRNPKVWKHGLLCHGAREQGLVGVEGSAAIDAASFRDPNQNGGRSIGGNKDDDTTVTVVALIMGFILF